jgi:DNA (cytosine-5)-methyltransferase 1
MASTITPENSHNPRRKENLETIVGRRLWPTPTAVMVEQPNLELTETGRRKVANGDSFAVGLADAVRLWPTPTSRDWKGASGFKDEQRNLTDLTTRAQIADGHRMWPTPRASELMDQDIDKVQERLENGRPYKARLEEAVALWPTPTASDWKGRGPNSQQQGLPEMVKRQEGLWPLEEREEETLPLYPTMSASGMGNTGSQEMLQKRVEAGSLTEDEKRGMTAGNGGRLNPTWVEWLMGFPLGWTDLEDSETQ